MPLRRLIALLLMLAPARAHAAATVSLKAVAKNGIPIAPTNNVVVARGDIVTAEVYLLGWGTPPFDMPTNSGMIQTFIATILEEGPLSNGSDGSISANLILPNGWDAPLIKDTCPCDNPSYPTCDAAYGCIGAGHTPSSMASVNINRSDFIFFGFSSFTAVDLSTLNLRFGGAINGTDGQLASRCQGGANVGGPCEENAECPGSTCNANFLSYAGTLNLKVGASACGTYTFNFSSDPTLTFITNPEALPITVVPAREGLTLMVTVFQTCPLPPYGACCDMTDPSFPTCSLIAEYQCSGANKRYGGNNSTCANINPPCWGGDPIIVASPAHCLIDGRRPYPPGMPIQRQGFDTWTLSFPSPPGITADAASDFHITQVPATTPPLPPTVSSVTVESANTVTIHLSGPVQLNKWTCVRHIASNRRYCVGFLPGDANYDRTALPNDILALIDNLNGARNPPLQLHQCDIDRSGVCAPADILSEIDLLNGANGFPVQNGRSLPPCPSTIP